MRHIVRLSREVRFGLAGELAHSSNSFAGQPVMEGMAPFVAMTVAVSGPIDPATGMLVNIKKIDEVVRHRAVKILREATGTRSREVTGVLDELFDGISKSLTAGELHVTGVAVAVSPYLSFAIQREERPMVRLSQRFEFSAAHRLHSERLSREENIEVFGRCNNPNGHGHNYELEVTVAGEPNPKTGVVMSIGDLQALVNEHIVNVFDHKHLNLDCAEFRNLNPTVENIACVLYRRLKPHMPGDTKLASIRVWETPKTMCEYGE
jgi:6-pyruvoyltetrahydropterin/6-carboxytetrahydropterin synthase